MSAGEFYFTLPGHAQIKFPSRAFPRPKRRLPPSQFDTWRRGAPRASTAASMMRLIALYYTYVRGPLGRAARVVLFEGGYAVLDTHGLPAGVTATTGRWIGFYSHEYPYEYDTTLFSRVRNMFSSDRRQSLHEFCLLLYVLFLTVIYQPTARISFRTSESTCNSRVGGGGSCSRNKALVSRKNGEKNLKKKGCRPILEHR